MVTSDAYARILAFSIKKVIHRMRVETHFGVVTYRRKARNWIPAFAGMTSKNYSPSVNRDAFPPAAVVLIVNVRSVTKRSR